MKYRSLPVDYRLEKFVSSKRYIVTKEATGPYFESKEIYPDQIIEVLGTVYWNSVRDYSRNKEVIELSGLFFYDINGEPDVISHHFVDEI